MLKHRQNYYFWPGILGWYATFTLFWMINGKAIGQTIDTIASMELILHTEDQVKMTKYVSGAYSAAGAIVSVEGNIEQVHPNSLCNDRPDLTFGNIYILKLKTISYFYTQERFCQSAAEKASIAIRNGASAVVMIITDHQEAIPELAQITRKLDRPVIIIQDVLEEDKLYTILSYKESAYMRITPVQLNNREENLSTQRAAAGGLLDKENITYIGISVIFALIMVLALIAGCVIMKLRRMRRQIRFESRGQLLNSIGTHKYMKRLRSGTLSSSSTLESTESCPICLEAYRTGEDVRALPCSHQYHKKCIDKWLLENRTCPCCCEDIDELLREGVKTLQTAEASKEFPYTDLSDGISASDRLLSSYTGSRDPSSNRPPAGYRHQRHIRRHGRAIQLAYPLINNFQPAYQREDLIQQQYQYLLYRLYQLKRHQAPSASISDTDNRFSAISSCYSSMLDIDDTLPSENVFIGDSCQGGLPTACSEFSLTDLDLASQIFKQYASSKSTLPSMESDNISPGVSEWDINEAGTNVLSRSASEKCVNMPHRLRSRSRTVTFRDPESEVMSSADDTTGDQSENDVPSDACPIDISQTEMSNTVINRSEDAQNTESNCSPETV